MSTHWWYVSVAWGLGLVLFGGLLADTLRRQSAARRHPVSVVGLRARLHPGLRGAGAGADARGGDGAAHPRPANGGGVAGGRRRAGARGLGGVMSLHWMHVSAAYALVVAGFIGLGAGAAVRHRAAKRRLAALDPRGGRRAAP